MIDVLTIAFAVDVDWCLSPSRLKVLHAARDSQKHITDIKWAPSGQSLAMGAADGKVYVYR